MTPEQDKLARDILSGLINDLVIWDKVKSNYASGVRHGLERAVKIMEEVCIGTSQEDQSSSSPMVGMSGKEN